MRFLKIFALSIVALGALVSSWAQDEIGTAVATDPPVPELVGISRIGDDVIVTVVAVRRGRSLLKVGGSVGPYELVEIDPESRYVDFERDGRVVRVWMQQAEIVTADGTFTISTDRENLDAIVAVLRRNTVWVGFDDLSEEEKDGRLRSQTRLLLRDPELSPRQRAERLASRLEQDRVLHIGPNGISAEEGTALGLTPDQIAEKNFMHQMGAELYKLYREEGKPVHITID